MKPQLSQHFCRMKKYPAVQHEFHVPLEWHHVETLIHFDFDYFFSITTYDIIFSVVVRYIINIYSMKQPDLYSFKATKMMSQT